MDAHLALEIADAIDAAIFDAHDWQRVATLFDGTLPGTRSVFGFYDAALMNEGLGADCSEEIIARVLGTATVGARLAHGLLQGKSL